MSVERVAELRCFMPLRTNRKGLDLPFGGRASQSGNSRHGPCSLSRTARFLRPRSQSLRRRSVGGRPATGRAELRHGLADRPAAGAICNEASLRAGGAAGSPKLNATPTSEWRDMATRIRGETEELSTSDRRKARSLLGPGLGNNVNWRSWRTAWRSRYTLIRRHAFRPA